MKLKDFIEYITEEMVRNKWQNRTLTFSTINREKLLFLSVQDSGKRRVVIDVGTEEDNDTNNGCYMEGK